MESRSAAKAPQAAWFAFLQTQPRLGVCTLLEPPLTQQLCKKSLSLMSQDKKGFTLSAPKKDYSRSPAMH